MCPSLARGPLGQALPPKRRKRSAITCVSWRGQGRRASIGEQGSAGLPRVSVSQLQEGISGRRARGPGALGEVLEGLKARHSSGGLTPVPRVWGVGRATLCLPLGIHVKVSEKGRPETDDPRETAVLIWVWRTCTWGKVDSGLCGPWEALGMVASPKLTDHQGDRGHRSRGLETGTGAPRVWGD